MIWWYSSKTLVAKNKKLIAENRLFSVKIENFGSELGNKKDYD